MAFRFSRAYVEYLHDEVAAYSSVGSDDRVSPDEYRDKALIESACARPFQSAFGQDIHPTVYRKAAAFFHSLVCNHCFGNGNKRTALIALDHFLAANDFYLIMDNDDAYELAKSTANHNEERRNVDLVIDYITQVIEEGSVLIDEMPEVITSEEYEAEFRIVYEEYCSLRKEVRSHELNQGANEGAACHVG